MPPTLTPSYSRERPVMETFAARWTTASRSADGLGDGAVVGDGAAHVGRDARGAALQGAHVVPVRDESRGDVARRASRSRR